MSPSSGLNVDSDRTSVSINKQDLSGKCSAYKGMETFVWVKPASGGFCTVQFTGEMGTLAYCDMIFQERREEIQGKAFQGRRMLMRDWTFFAQHGYQSVNNIERGLQIPGMCISEQCKMIGEF